MNDLVEKLKKWFSSQPSWLRAIVIALVAIVLVLSTLFSTSSCGLAKSVRVDYGSKRKVEKTDSIRVSYPNVFGFPVAMRVRTTSKDVVRF